MAGIALKIRAGMPNSEYRDFTVVYVAPYFRKILEEAHIRVCLMERADGPNPREAVFRDNILDWALVVEQSEPLSCSTSNKQLKMNPSVGEGQCCRGYTKSTAAIKSMIYGLNKKFYSNEELDIADVWSE